MNWEKSKKIMIITLIMLNAVLLSLNLEKSRKYTLTQERENNVYAVLAKNDIGIYASIIRKFKPMREISVTTPDISRNTLKTLFFDSGEDTTLAIEDAGAVIFSKTKKISVENNRLSFNCPEGTGKIENFGQQTAASAAAAFLSGKEPLLKNLKQSGVLKQEDGYMVEYYGNFMGSKIFCSYCRVKVTEAGVISMSAVCFDIGGFVGERSDICASDEALLTLVHELRPASAEKTWFITKMEIGYDIEESGEIAGDGGLRLIPCYYIYLQDMEEPMVINAYTNRIKG